MRNLVSILFTVLYLLAISVSSVYATGSDVTISLNPSQPYLLQTGTTVVMRFNTCMQSDLFLNGFRQKLDGSPSDYSNLSNFRLLYDNEEVAVGQLSGPNIKYQFSEGVKKIASGTCLANWKIIANLDLKSSGFTIRTSIEFVEAYVYPTANDATVEGLPISADVSFAPLPPVELHPPYWLPITATTNEALTGEWPSFVIWFPRDEPRSLVLQVSSGTFKIPAYELPNGVNQSQSVLIPIGQIVPYTEKVTISAKLFDQEGNIVAWGSTELATSLEPKEISFLPNIEKNTYNTEVSVVKAIFPFVFTNMNHQLVLLKDGICILLPSEIQSVVSVNDGTGTTEVSFRSISYGLGYFLPKGFYTMAVMFDFGKSIVPTTIYQVNGVYLVNSSSIRVPH